MSIRAGTEGLKCVPQVYKGEGCLVGGAQPRCGMCSLSSHCLLACPLLGSMKSYDGMHCAGRDPGPQQVKWLEQQQ